MATVSDVAGNTVSDSTAGELVIDTTVPAVAPTVDSATTNDTTPDITGSATLDTGETLSVTVDGTTYTVGDGNLTLDAVSNTWSLTIPNGSELAEGSYDVVATDSDAAGNAVSDSTTGEIIIDTTVPAVAPTVDSATTNDTTPVITGSC